MASCHTSTYQGKRVFIILKNGIKIIGKFKESKAKFVFLDTGKINIEDIKSLSINRNEIPNKYQ